LGKYDYKSSCKLRDEGEHIQSKNESFPILI
jgi:hypothetical protein